MSFKITIINNENGEVFLNEENAKAIIGAVASEEDVMGVIQTNCNAYDLLATLEAVDTTKDKILKDNPKLQLPYALKGLMNLDKSKSDD